MRGLTWASLGEVTDTSIRGVVELRRYELASAGFQDTCPSPPSSPSEDHEELRMNDPWRGHHLQQLWKTRHGPVMYGKARFGSDHVSPLGANTPLPVVLKPGEWLQRGLSPQQCLSSGWPRSAYKVFTLDGSYYPVPLQI